MCVNYFWPGLRGSNSHRRFRRPKWYPFHQSPKLVLKQRIELWLLSYQDSVLPLYYKSKTGCCSIAGNRTPISTTVPTARPAEFWWHRVFAEVILKKYQTPVDADLSAIKEFYKNCPKGFEVDHIIPISKGGPHSLSNLQYLSSIDNKKKSAKLNWCP